MTRKRYIKLFMALSVSRNAANRMADYCRAKGIPYAVNYSTSAPWLQLGKEARMARAAILNLSSGARAALQGCADSVAWTLHHLNAHPAQPITPETLAPGSMLIVTQQKHAELHGYSAKVSFVDENHTAPRHDDAIDALSYSALIAGRGNGRSDATLAQKHFKKITDVSLVASGGYPLGGGQE